MLMLHACLVAGDWGEFKNMRMKWKDESTLVINAVETPSRKNGMWLFWVRPVAHDL